MPIYEFRCLKCGEVLEMLFTSASESRMAVCGSCGSEELERIMSAASYSVSGSKAAPATTGCQRSCGAGSCTTVEIPGRGD